MRYTYEAERQHHQRTQSQTASNNNNRVDPTIAPSLPPSHHTSRFSHGVQPDAFTSSPKVGPDTRPSYGWDDIPEDVGPIRPVDGGEGGAYGWGNIPEDTRPIRAAAGGAGGQSQRAAANVTLWSKETRPMQHPPPYSSDAAAAREIDRGRRPSFDTRRFGDETDLDGEAHAMMVEPSAAARAWQSPPVPPSSTQVSIPCIPVVDMKQAR